MRNTNKNIVKNYKDLPPAEVLRFGSEFVGEFFFDEKSPEIPINAMKVIFNIVSILRNEQFQEKNQPQQLQLFEEEFASEHNTYAKMKIRNSMITRNSAVLKQTYEFLENFKKGWYKFTTSEGKKIQAYGGLISNIFYEENGYTSFLISSYWIKKLIHIPEYNTTFYNLVYKVRSPKHVLFWFWLCRIPKEGTRVIYTKFNKTFAINYANSKSLCKDFLKPIRDNFDKFTDLSFNYSIQGDKINIKPYSVKNIDKETYSEELVKKTDYKQTIRYYKERYNLNEENVKRIEYAFNHFREWEKELIRKAHNMFIERCRKLKEKATDFQNDEFIKILQQFIEFEYIKTETGKKLPTAFPKI